MWNYHNTEGARTNNHAEGWHAKINRVTGKPHPNIFEVIELFKGEQASVEVKIAQLEAGGRGQPRKRVCIRKWELVINWELVKWETSQMRVGKAGVGKAGVDQTGVGQMVPNHSVCPRTIVTTPAMVMT